MRNVRFGLRMLLKRPGLSATAVIALALGIGLTTTMFSIVYGVVLRGLPFDQSDELMALHRSRPAHDIDVLQVSIHDYVDWRNQQTSFDDIAVYYGETVNLSGREGRPIRYQGAYVSAHFFDLLGVQPQLGRVFRSEEDHPSTPPVMLLSHRAWEARFAGDPTVVGRTVRANSQVTTIVGVMPEGFDFPGQIDAWLPLRIDPLAFPRGSGPALEQTQLQAVGRLRDGISMVEAQTEMTAIAGRLETEHPETNSGIGIVVTPLIEFFIGGQAIAMLYVMLGAVFLVLLIACANVANLLLARTVLRTKEVALRTALGAGRRRIMSDLLAETLVLAVAGTAIGLLIAQVGIDFFNATLLRIEAPMWLRVGLDPAVLVFVLGLTLAATLLAGAVPAWRASRSDVRDILNDENRGTSSLRLGRLSKGLVVVEIAFSCALLVSTGLMVQSIVNIGRFDYGFPTDNILTARIGLFAADYPSDAARLQFYEELLQRLGERPGIRQVALTSDLPSTGASDRSLTVDGVAYPSPEDHPRARRVVISPGYFDTLAVRPVRGRVFTPADTAASLPVAVVNERFVDLFLDAADPLGRRVRLGEDDPWRTIVGVVPDLYLGGVAGVATRRDEGVYIPLAQSVIDFMSIIARTDAAPLTLTSVVQDDVEAIDPNLPIYWVRSLADQYALNAWFYRTFGALFTAFGLVALSLATIGLYGVMAFSTGNRTREIGVRMALGARASSVLTLVLGSGLLQLISGLLLGVGFAAVLARGLGALLFGVSPWEASIFILVVCTMSVAGTVACVIPASRATRVDPIEALRYE